MLSSQVVAGVPSPRTAPQPDTRLRPPSTHLVHVIGTPHPPGCCMASAASPRLTVKHLRSVVPRQPPYVQEYTYVTFPSETITRSGYNIRRKNFAVACVKRDMLYTLNGEADGGSSVHDRGAGGGAVVSTPAQTKPNPTRGRRSVNTSPS